KGLLRNAIVTFRPVTGGVVETSALATIRTDAVNGTFSSPVTFNGPVVAVLTVDGATTMLDELSGTAMPAPTGLVLHAMIPGLATLQPLAITPLTELAYQKALALGGFSVANINAANGAVGSALLGGQPILQTLPIALANWATATPAQQAQAKLLTALAVAAS